MLVDLPGLSPVTDVIFETHDFSTDQVTTATGVIDLVLDGRPLRLDLTPFPDPSS